MTKLSTAAVMVSAQSFGPWGDDGWRVAGIVELVEGGSNGPFLLTQVFDDSKPQHVKAVVVGSVLARDVARSIVTFIAYTWGSDDVRARLNKAGFLGRRESEGYVSEEFVADDALTAEAVTAVKDFLKCGVVVLDTVGDISVHLVSELEGLGIQAEAFVSTEAR